MHSYPNSFVHIITHTGFLCAFPTLSRTDSLLRPTAETFELIQASEVAAERSSLRESLNARPSRGVARVFRHTPCPFVDVYEEVYC